MNLKTFKGGKYSVKVLGALSHSFVSKVSDGLNQIKKVHAFQGISGDQIKKQNPMI